MPGARTPRETLPRLNYTIRGAVRPSDGWRRRPGAGASVPNCKLDLSVCITVSIVRVADCEMTIYLRYAI